MRSPNSYADESDRIARAQKASQLARQAINTSVLLRYLAEGESAEPLHALFVTAESFVASVKQIDIDRESSTKQSRPLEYALPYSRLVPVKVWRQLLFDADLAVQIQKLLNELPALLMSAKQGQQPQRELLLAAAALLEQVARKLLGIASLRSV